ncbi:hypothetical protein CVV38_00920 [Candidatus Peregrinibacteria bacterium HGW-Peregrinibacteria-1]|jgi:ABC-type multidrug transport system fused ATPase/permease subunit|nr:MAG: hypothetical protein CVV38_00920 [Candidatus Peregrinibacteria bacterium HGW-Peregrinibacteria-1]
MKISAKLAQEPTIFLLKKMWKYAKGHRHLVLIFTGMFILAQLTLLLSPLLFGVIINEIQANGVTDNNLTHIIILLLGFVAIDLGFWIFHGPARLLENIAAFRSERNYREHLLSGVLNLGLSWHSTHDSGDTIDKVNNASMGMYRFSSFIFLIIEVLIKVIGTTAILFFFNVYLGSIALGLVILALIIIFLFDVRLIPQYKALNNFYNKISAVTFDSISNITTVKALQIEKPVFKNIHHALWKPFQLFKKNNALSEAKWFAGSLMFSVILVLPIIAYLYSSHKNQTPIEVGTISTIYLYLANLIGVYFTFTSHYSQIILNKTLVVNALPIEEAITKDLRAEKKPVKPWQKIAVQNLSFKYEDDIDGTHHIKNISLEFSRGEKVALIGESGAGKSTFLKVLHGMYPSATTEMSFDDNPSKKINISEINLKTTLVPQEPEIFSASIKENLTLGLTFKAKNIDKATKMAVFKSVINALPQGLNSIINEKGVNLSGGQKQRLALSRALLFAEEKEIILLDESTSSVDPENELKIYKNIFKNFQGKTILASIHKMNLLKYFDRIIIFSQGKIIDQGTFAELLDKNPKFRKDWEDYIKQDSGL